MKGVPSTPSQIMCESNMPSADADQVTRFRHTSVLLEGAVDALVHDSEGIYLDGTFGRGGHSRLILSRLSEQGRLSAKVQQRVDRLSLSGPVRVKGCGKSAPRAWQQCVAW